MLSGPGTVSDTYTLLFRFDTWNRSAAEKKKKERHMQKSCDQGLLVETVNAVVLTVSLRL